MFKQTLNIQYSLKFVKHDVFLCDTNDFWRFHDKVFTNIFKSMNMKLKTLHVGKISEGLVGELIKYRHHAHRSNIQIHTITHQFWKEFT